MTGTSPLVLAIDTASGRTGVALAGAGGVRVERYLDSDKAKGEHLGRLVSEALAAAGARVEDIAGIGVSTGPGSYTGLRVGLAFARGVALLSDLPAVGVGSLELLAASCHGVPRGRPLAAAADAGRGRAYFGRLESAAEPGGEAPRTAGAPELVDAEALTRRLEALPADAVLCCDEALAAAASVRETITAPAGRAAVLAAIAAHRIDAGRFVTAAEVLPVYAGGLKARKNRNRVVLGAGEAH